MDSFQKYVNEQFIGKDPSRVNVGRDIFKSLKDNWMDKLGYIPQKPMALIKVTKQNSPIIKGLGFSEPDDLLLDNFGVMLSSCINTGSDVQRNVVDEIGITRTMHWQENGNFPNAFTTADSTPGPAFALGGLIEIGFGDSQGNPWNPQRSDFQLRQRFIVVPQSLFQNVSTPEWISNVQNVVLTSQVNGVVGDFNVGECGMFEFFRRGFTTNADLIMLSHDKTGLMVSDGDNIKTTYTWSLS